MSKFSSFVRDSYYELLDKVSWPKWDALQQSTMIVIGATIVITAIIWVMDFIAQNAMQFIYSLFD